MASRSDGLCCDSRCWESFQTAEYLIDMAAHGVLEPRQWRAFLMALVLTAVVGIVSNWRESV